MAVAVGSMVRISIHALREESDAQVSSMVQSALLISIHALREESDCALRVVGR